MSSLSSKYDEKRNFIRMFVNADVEIINPSDNKRYNGQGKNLSGDGALFTSNQKFNVDQILNLEIKAEQSSLAALCAEFKVVRVEELSDGLYEIAGIMLNVK